MAEPRMLEVELADRTYPVWIGEGLLARAGELIPMPATARKVALFHDAAIRPDVQLPGVEVVEHVVSNESSKSVTEADKAWQLLAANDFHRGDLVVAVGGGVTSDLAGFVAATYHRGLPWAVVPTTLLGMVDAAIGGKTGINLPQGKNLVGAFNQPIAVLCDVAFLKTLPEAALATGMAEVIKHGFIARADLLERIDTRRDEILARDPATMIDLVADAADVKVRIVSEDETEQGARAFLNYGHTLGHALEVLGGYERWTHGEAVSLGMMFVANLGARLGFADLVDRHRAALERFGLPTAGATFPFEQVAQTWRGDKKFDARARFVVLQGLGRPTIVTDPPEDALRAAYEAVR